VLALEIVMSIPLVIIGIGFVVVMAAFMSPRLAGRLEAWTVPRWPRTKGWFHDPSTAPRPAEPEPEEPDPFG
jgi:hypothetical protein